MTKTTTNLLLMLTTILAGIYFYVNYCSSCAVGDEALSTDKEEMVVPPPKEATSYPFALSDGDFALNINDNFNFNSSSSSILMPVSSKVDEGISGLKGFLDANADKVINIIGYYTSDETNDSAYPNLGLARANAVKNYLVSKGIPSSRINTFGELKDDMVDKAGVYLGPLGYKVNVVAEDLEDQLHALYDRIKANPLVLYFETGEDTIALTPEQRQKIADISRYLDKVKDATCNIVGHTDNTGDLANNIVLGQGRADFVKAYLVRNGISETKISATSKGQDQPIADNTTEEGRAKNRRTVITLN